MEIGPLRLNGCPRSPVRVRRGISTFVEIGAPLIAPTRCWAAKVGRKQCERYSILWRPGRFFRYFWIDDLWH